MLRLLTAGESHGKKMTLIIEGLPKGLTVDEGFLSEQLYLRRNAAGRSERQKKEEDRIEILSGLSGGVTTAAPLAISIENVATEKKPPLYCLRPGHADYAGVIKYALSDARTVAERASARETALRTVAGGVAQLFLKQIFVSVLGYNCGIGGDRYGRPSRDKWEGVKRNPFRCLAEDTALAEGKIISAAAQGDSVGGSVEVIISGLPAGFGNYNHFDKRLDARLAFDAMSVQSVKAVEIGLGTGYGGLMGSEAHDSMQAVMGKIVRSTNNAGGIEGGVSNGEEIIVRSTVKPVPTIAAALNSVNISTGENQKAAYERSDVCAVPAAAVILENVLAFTIASEVLECLGGDTMDEIVTRFIIKRGAKCL